MFGHRKSRSTASASEFKLFPLNRALSIRSGGKQNQGGSSQGGSRRGFSFSSLRGAGQPELSKKLFLLIKTQNNLIGAYEAAGKERLSVGTQLSDWGEQTGDDAISELSDKIGVLLSELGEQEDVYAHNLDDARSVLKTIRNTEKSVQPSRDNRQKIQDEIHKLKMKEPENTRLVVLEQELVRAEAENLVAEAQLTNITRQKLKEAYAAEFASTIERAEKQIILARHGRRMLNLLDDTPVIPGDTRPQFEHGDQARQILNDAEEDLRDWRLEADDVPISNQLDSNLMPTSGGGAVADTRYEEGESLQTIPSINESQTRNTGGTYLPHGTTLVGGVSSSRATNGQGGASKPRATCVRGYSMPVVTRALACLSSSSPFQQRPTKQALINLTNTSPSQNYTRNHIPRQIGGTDVKMDSLVARYSRPMFENEGYAKEQQEEMELVQEVPALSLKFAMPPVAQPSSWLRAATDDYSNPNCPIKIAHGTTTLAFRFQGGIIVATDSRATAGNWIASQTVKKVIEINSSLLGTMAGGAADCQYWLAYLGMQCRLHELRQKRRITVAAASKILANIVYSYKGMGLSMGTMCAGVTPSEGPALYYIDSDGTRLAGNLFCVGSGQTFAYGVLDAEYKYDLTEEEALELGRRSILAATHRDAYSGGYINLYHVKEEGWVKHGFNDTNPIFWKTKLEKGEFSNVTSELV
ncbi:hypothetical protein V498_07297 [Pseudogymnoascus sp. VKM F-4517 (FW-2822)]|nr:hypothetical protein V498_07297 [Pseudogymnoascus sp. VKM F-4517 (FW-2822)]